MSSDLAVELCRNAVMLTLLLCFPALVVSLVVGLVISLGQAVTQLQEQTLSFVPKLVALVLILLYTLPWSMQVMEEYSTNLIRDIPASIGTADE